MTPSVTAPSTDETTTIPSSSAATTSVGRRKKLTGSVAARLVRVIPASFGDVGDAGVVPLRLRSRRRHRPVLAPRERPCAEADGSGAVWLARPSQEWIPRLQLRLLQARPGCSESPAAPYQSAVYLLPG